MAGGNDRVRKVDYWYATVPDLPGAPNEVLQRLARSQVSLIAYLAFPVPGGKTQLDLIPAEPAAFEQAAKAAGVKLSARKQALMIQGVDRVGALSEKLARLAEKAIRCVAGTAVATPGGGYGLVLWVEPAKIDSALEVLSG